MAAAQVASKEPAKSRVKASRWELFLAGQYVCPFCSCTTFFGIGILFTVIFFMKITSEGDDIFEFDIPLVKSDIRIQQEAAFLAAKGDKEGCLDEAHQEDKETCEKDENCQWDPNVQGGGRDGSLPKRCKTKQLCPSPEPLPRELPMLFEGGTAWVGIIYEATDDGNIFDDNILEHIRKFEEAVLTDVNGAKRETNGQKIASPWNRDWCLYTYPSATNGEGRCMAPGSIVNLFSMTEEGRAATAAEAMSGYTNSGPFVCMCSDADALCASCTEDGGIKGFNETSGTLDATSWGPSILRCLAEMVLASSPAAANTTSAPAAEDPELNEVCNTGSSAAAPSTVEELLRYYTPVLKSFCQAKPSCQWAPPRASTACASTSFYHPEHITKLATGSEKAAAMEKMCDDDQPGWSALRKEHFPMSFTCGTGELKTPFARSSWFVGGSGDDEEGDTFLSEYIEGMEGWFAKETQLEADIESSSDGALRIMLFSAMTVRTQFLAILMIDGLLAIFSLVSVWAYLWWGLESAFLASVAMFEIVFSLPVAMSLWTVVIGQKIYFFQMLCIYMILGIGADDAFILYDAWLQSKFAGDEVDSEDWTSRFAWAYRRSFKAMFVTTATTCGSFCIGAASTLPQVQTFCIFAVLVVLVDWIFCETLFASAIVVHDKFIKSSTREAGECCGPGCCCGLSKIIAQAFCSKCVGPLPKRADPPQKRGMEVFCEGTLFRFLRKWRFLFIGFWTVVVVAMMAVTGALLRTAEKANPLGKESLDTIRGLEILIQEFSIFGVPTTSFVYGLNAEEPVTWGDSGEDDHPNYDPTESAKIETPAGQLELLSLCRSADSGKQGSLRCEERSCLIAGKSASGSCMAQEDIYRRNGVYMPGDLLCQSGRYCFMEDFARYWAVYVEGKACRADAASTPTTCANTANCEWDMTHSVCYTTISPEDYPGLPADDFVSHLASDEYAAYVTMRSDMLRANGREYENTLDASLTGVRLNPAKDAILFAWVSFNATYPAQNTVDEANDWYDRWEAFRIEYTASIGGFQTTELYSFMVTQNEMVKAAVMGVCLSLLITFIVLMLATRNWIVSLLGLANIVSIAVVFMGLIPIVGWSLGENESIFMIAVVGLSVDYSVHLLHVYNSCRKETRADRTQAALGEMGISVVNSAITTLLAAFILFWCGFYFFIQFGGFIFIVIGLSILMSITFLMPLMLVLGPEGTQGALNCCKRAEKSSRPALQASAP